MEGLKSKKYLRQRRRRFDPVSLGLSLVGIGAVLYGVSDTSIPLWDLRSFLVVIGGTFACVLFQFDLAGTVQSMRILVNSFWGIPSRHLTGVMNQLDEAILGDTPLSELREGESLNGELLNDVVFMHNSGLLFEEIDEFVTSKIKDQWYLRQEAVRLLDKAAVLAPALGLFGTVIGLIGVLKNLSQPGQIGGSMALALMTTAYGAGIGSLFLSPMAGRLEHHNEIFLEAHQQFLGRIAILLKRQERDLEHAHDPTEFVA